MLRVFDEQLNWQLRFKQFTESSNPAMGIIASHLGLIIIIIINSREKTVAYESCSLGSEYNIV